MTRLSCPILCYMNICNVWIKIRLKQTWDVFGDDKLFGFANNEVWHEELSFWSYSKVLTCLEGNQLILYSVHDWCGLYNLLTFFSTVGRSLQYVHVMLFSSLHLITTPRGVNQRSRRGGKWQQFIRISDLRVFHNVLHYHCLASTVFRK